MASFKLAPLPHREAIEYFRSKGFAHELQRFHHLDHFREDHARNFVVAKAMRDDVLAAIRAELERALTEGRTLFDFQRDLMPRLQQMGWWGRTEMLDPVTNEMQEVQLGSLRRLKVIFDTNMRTAHAAGHWAAIQRTKRAFPYLHYIQIQRPTKRHDHARFHDKIWHVDDPIWLKIYPPNGYFCGCQVFQRTEGWVRRNSRSIDERLDLDEEDWTHKRSGEVHQIPRGITPGFDTNPGATWLDTAERWEQVTPDLSPERRLRERALIEGLRLRRLSDGRETLIITDADSRPIGQWSAERDRPHAVSFNRSGIAPSASFLHSHITDATLSSDDISTLFRDGGYAITAIGPGGSIWRAVRVVGADYRPGLAEFSGLLSEFGDELRANPHGSDVFYHARMRWLEKKGIVTYHYGMSERVRQIMATNDDLIERLVNARP